LTWAGVIDYKKPATSCDNKAGAVLTALQRALQVANPNLNWGEKPVAEVVIQESESLENALRRFKRKVQQEDIIKEIKKHSFYMKPGEKRRAKEALSRKRLRKKQRREQD
jgi:small subunit ribosomal protein S21